MLLGEKFTDEETEFEKKLLLVLRKTGDPLQLIKIIKRKLSINNPTQGARNL